MHRAPLFNYEHKRRSKLVRWLSIDTWEARVLQQLLQQTTHCNPLKQIEDEPRLHLATQLLSTQASHAPNTRTRARNTHAPYSVRCRAVMLAIEVVDMRNASSIRMAAVG